MQINSVSVFGYFIYSLFVYNGCGWLITSLLEFVYSDILYSGCSLLINSLSVLVYLCICVNLAQWVQRANNQSTSINVFVHIRCSVPISSGQNLCICVEWVQRANTQWPVFVYLCTVGAAC